jgi:hypothetical protein
VKLATTLAFTTLIVGTFGISANAQTLGATDIRKQVQNATPITTAGRLVVCVCVDKRRNGTCARTKCS